MKPDARFGLTTLTCVVIASMIGSGVFTTSGFSIAALGSAERVLVAWCIGGVVAICGAIAYGELARRLPVSGGE
jgi:APA family basic amino acid/polyamine antiporter